MTTNKQNYQEHSSSLYYHHPVTMNTYSTLPLDRSSNINDHQSGHHSTPSSPTSISSSTPLTSPSLISSKIGRFNTVSAGQLGKLSRQYQYDSQDGDYFQAPTSPPNRHQFYSLHVSGHQWMKTNHYDPSITYSNDNHDQQDGHSGRKLFQKMGRPSKSVDQSQLLCRSGFSHYDFYSPCVDFYRSIQRGQLYKQQSSTGASAAAQAMEQHQQYHQVDNHGNISPVSDGPSSPSASPCSPSNHSSYRMYLADQPIIEDCAHFRCEFYPQRPSNPDQIHHPYSDNAQGDLKSGWWKIMGQCHDHDTVAIDKFEYFDYGAHFYRYRFFGKGKSI